MVVSVASGGSSRENGSASAPLYAVEHAALWLIVVLVSENELD